MPNNEAQDARQRADEAREEAEQHVRDEVTEKWGETMTVVRRLRDHGRADTFTAMVQYELTRKRKTPGGNS